MNNPPPRPRPQLVLASASPARRQLLRAAGIEADVVVSGVDESTVEASGAQELCLRLAQRKALAAADRLPRDSQPHARTLVLGCDSVLSFAGEVLGKPTGAADAIARWRRMRGNHGTLFTGHAVVAVESARVVAAVAGAEVHFGQVSDEEIEAYVATGEPLAVAGAFTIDGYGSPFIERIDGDPGTVIGLSLPLLRQLLSELGISITELWRG